MLVFHYFVKALGEVILVFKGIFTVYIMNRRNTLELASRGERASVSEYWSV